jgi:hypothetical protein
MVPEESVATFFGDMEGEPGRTPAAAPAAPQPERPKDPPLAPNDLALIAEACSKSGVVWVKPATEQRYHGAWHVWHDGAVAVVHGVDEQSLPPLEGRVEVAVRSKDTGARLVRFTARVDVVPAGSPQWEATADALSAARLNARDTAEQRDRWRTNTVIVRLVPVAMTASGPGADDESPEMAQPPGNPGTTINWRPFHIGGRKLRRGNRPYR